jgi:hypothetical protein
LETIVLFTISDILTECRHYHVVQL